MLKREDISGRDDLARLEIEACPGVQSVLIWARREIVEGGSSSVRSLQVRSVLSPPPVQSLIFHATLREQGSVGDRSTRLDRTFPSLANH